MTRFDKIALAAVVLTSLLFYPDISNAAYLYIEMYSISGKMLLIGLAGWFIATFGPLGIAVYFRHLARRVRAPWLLHILLLPCAFVLLRTGELLMLHVIGDPDFDSSLGGPVVQAYILFVFALAGYFVSLTSARVRTQSEQA